MSSVRIKGHVKWFDTTKGFGFIRSEESNDKDIFVHQSTIHAAGFRSLNEGEEVEFSLVTDAKGMHAENVTGPGGKFVKGAAQKVPKKNENGSDRMHDQATNPTFGFENPNYNPMLVYPYHRPLYAPQFHPAVYSPIYPPVYPQMIPPMAVQSIAMHHTQMQQVSMPVNQDNEFSEQLNAQEKAHVAISK